MCRKFKWSWLRANGWHLKCLQEQLISSKFKSFPNTLNIHKVFVDDGSDCENFRDWKRDFDNVYVCQVTDHCPYGNLYDMIEQFKGKKFPWRVARHIAGQIIGFIEKAHKVEGIVHTRLNPKNILFNENLTLKINDFFYSKFFWPNLVDMNVYNPL